jgi:hypothetical protein
MNKSQGSQVKIDYTIIETKKNTENILNNFVKIRYVLNNNEIHIPFFKKYLNKNNNNLFIFYKADSTFLYVLPVTGGILC